MISRVRVAASIQRSFAALTGRYTAFPRPPGTYNGAAARRHARTPANVAAPPRSDCSYQGPVCAAALYHAGALPLTGTHGTGGIYRRQQPEFVFTLPARVAARPAKLLSSH